ncbi:MAG TPA: ATP-binding protein [Candidatus Limnocylindria bacterium]|nr:ATP-binding protein [Candidatus Limnocylindria bacterium]
MQPAPPRGPALATLVAEGTGALAAATLLVAALDGWLEIEDASPAYLLAVTVMAIRRGTGAAVVTAVGSVLTYNLLFVEPRFTLLVARPAELVTLGLLLFTGVVIGRLAGMQRDRERVAERRESEARALAALARHLAVARSAADALGSIVALLVAATDMERVWVGIGSTTFHERVAMDSAADGLPPPVAATHTVLRHDRPDGGGWVRIHPPGAALRREERASAPLLHRVEISDGGEALGSIWAVRRAGAGAVREEETRLLAAAADQLGQALVRERLAAAAAELEIARRSDELKGALLDSVSHDLRTPLAAIRASAGMLRDEDIHLSPDERRVAAAAIDGEAERLSRLVTNLLDMSRIRAGELVPRAELVPVEELVEPAVERVRPQLAGRRLDVSLDGELPALSTDPAIFDQVIGNLLENATRHTPPGTTITVSARTRGTDAVDIRVEDDGPGVPEADLGRLFERFSRGVGAQRGFGLGLAVARGMVEALGGSIAAAAGGRGGLAVTVTLPVRGPAKR